MRAPLPAMTAKHPCFCMRLLACRKKQAVINVSHHDRLKPHKLAKQTIGCIYVSTHAAVSQLVINHVCLQLAQESTLEGCAMST